MKKYSKTLIIFFAIFILFIVTSTYIYASSVSNTIDVNKLDLNSINENKIDQLKDIIRKFK